MRPHEIFWNPQKNPTGRKNPEEVEGENEYEREIRLLIVPTMFCFQHGVDYNTLGLILMRQLKIQI